VNIKKVVKCLAEQSSESERKAMMMLCMSSSSSEHLTVLIVYLLMAVGFELTSQSEILIIRHGRSRSRHSTEKDHVRWGLKALDNLTIIENHLVDGTLIESGENDETNADELSVVSFFDNNNGTLSQSSEFNASIGSYEINFTHSPTPLPPSSSSSSAVSHGGNEKVKKHHSWKGGSSSSSSSSPSSSSSSSSTAALQSHDKYLMANAPDLAAALPTIVKRRSGRKKEIMSDIKNTVNKGIQYLKSHENLDEIEIEINDYNTKQQQQQRSHEPKKQIKKLMMNEDDSKRTAESSNKMRGATQSIAAAAKMDQIPVMLLYGNVESINSNNNIKMKRKSHSGKQIKINGGKDFSIVTIQSSLDSSAAAASSSSSSHSSVNEKNKKLHPTSSRKSSSSSSSKEKPIMQQQQQQQEHYEAPTVKHIKNHQVRNEMDMNINSNLADVFYVPTSTEEANPFNDEQMQNDEPAGNKSGMLAGDEESQLMENSNQQHNQKQKKTHSTVAPLLQIANHTSKSNQTKMISSSSSNEGVATNNNHHHHQQHDSKSVVHVKPHESLEARTQPPNSNNNNIKLDEHEGNQHDDDDGASEEFNNEDFMDAIGAGIQNDDTSQQKDNFDIVDGPSDPIFDVEDLEPSIDLEDLDETSRNNRKNLMRGRDVVTRFLQIVESQHIMGGNCTAGTALNLGEGVVDRYAQDRFRVEAEVAVNRANMLTR